MYDEVIRFAFVILQVLAAATLREAEQQLPQRESLASEALISLVAHLQRVHALGVDGTAGPSLAVRAAAPA
jgi:hypothetical protein